MTKFLVCSFLMATAQPSCITGPIDLVEAVAIIIASNNTFPFKINQKQTPYTLFEANGPPREAK